MKKILVIGSSGQIGTELVEGLRARFGMENDRQSPGAAMEITLWPGAITIPPDIPMLTD